MFSTSYTRRLWKTALLPILDFLALVISGGIVYLFRYRWADDSLLGINFGIKQISGYDYLNGTLILALLIVLMYAFLGLYEVGRKVRVWKSLLQLAFGVFSVILGLITFYFFYEFDRQALPAGVPVSRFILGTVGFVALYAVLLLRGIVWTAEQFLYALGLGKVNLIVIGDKGKTLGKLLSRRADVQKVLAYQELSKVNFLEIEQYIKTGTVAEIYMYGHQSDLETDLAILSERYKVSCILAPSGFGRYQAFDFKPIVVGGKTFLELKHSNLDGWQVVLKRLFDLIFALSFLIIFSLVYLVIAIAIKLDSKGPIFYLSERIGPNGKVFRIWKFRRMKQEFSTSEVNPEAKQALEYEQKLLAEKNMRQGGVLYKIQNDPRNTRVGAFIERTSLDELPQFFNVVLGNLSIVGPRPHQPREVAKYNDHHFKVLNIKPGITGLAQINGRSDLTFEQEVTFDTFYVEHWSFWLDLWVIIKTPLVVFFKRHKG